MDLNSFMHTQEKLVESCSWTEIYIYVVHWYPPRVLLYPPRYSYYVTYIENNLFRYVFLHLIIIWLPPSAVSFSWCYCNPLWFRYRARRSRCLYIAGIFFFLSGFPTKIMYVYFVSSVRATCPAHLIIISLAIILLRDPEHKIQNS